MMLEQNLFAEAMLPAQILRDLTDEEMTHYRRPFLNAGEDRRPHAVVAAQHSHR